MRPIAIRSRRRESPEEIFLMRISVLTISDSVTKGEREDLSGPAVVAFCRGLGWEITSSLRVSDDPANIREQLRAVADSGRVDRSEEHTSELQSHVNLVCRLLLEKKKM